MSLLPVAWGWIPNCWWRRGIAVVWIALAGIAGAQPALVGPAGYTNAFTTRPAAPEWTTASWPGFSYDTYNINTVVPQIVAASIITQVLDSGAADPPAANSLAGWSQGGSRYLVTRPSGNRMTLLMLRLQNVSGTNATAVRLAYDLGIKAQATEPDHPGLRAFYSLTGDSNSWVALPQFSSTTPVAGRLTANVTLATPWNVSNLLYVVWADDNTSSLTPDPAYAIDNFTAQVTAGAAVRLPVTVTLASPTNNQSFLAPDAITLAATASAPGFSITNVEFFVNGQKVGEDTGSPYSFVWNNPPLGPYRLHAVATDNTGVIGQSAPVGIVVYDAAGTPQVRLVTPSNGFAAIGPTNLTITAMVAARGGATSVDFYADSTLIGTGLPLAPSADYQFENSLADLTGTAPALANLGPNTFAPAVVDGTSRTVLRFAANDGLSLTNVSSLGLANGYSIVVLFSFETPSSWRRILDFRNGVSDYGLYSLDDRLYFYPGAPGSPAGIVANSFVQVVLTRNASGTVVGFVNGVQQFSFLDTGGEALPDAANVLRLFRDDGTEGSAGRIARLRFYERALSAGEVAVLDRLPGASSVVGAFSMEWPAPLGTHVLSAIASDAFGRRGTSDVAQVTITIPPTNTIAPTLVAVSPVRDTTVGALSFIEVTFSEPVQNVNAADLLINGVPGDGFFASPDGYSFLFVFPQPAYGPVQVSWATNHGITDFGQPIDLSFDHTLPGATWSYLLVDQTPPTVAARMPAAGTAVSNLTQITVVFSEDVTGVDAADLLVSGVPALAVNGGGASYTFRFAQPEAGQVNISWASEHGIEDTAALPFNALGPGAGWYYLFDPRVALVPASSTWHFRKGLAEASSPPDAWRQRVFDDAEWTNSPAPFFFGDPYSNGVPAFTLLNDMLGNYTSIYLRKRFNVTGASDITNLWLNFQIDDGFVAWINGVEVFRFAAPPGEVPYNGRATAAATEPNQSGARFLLTTLANPGAYLVEGENVLAVHAMNASLSGSSDFGFNAELLALIPDLTVVAPAIAEVTPLPGTITGLTNFIVRFSEGVQGVEAADLLINGVPASAVSSATNTTYVFQFPQPAFGSVLVTWAAGHGITDLDPLPKPFYSTRPGTTFSYSLVNADAPAITARTPPAGSTIGQLTELVVSFSEAVTGVDAADLLINNAPAASVSGGPVNYTFTVVQPANGAVSIGWAANHGITDTDPAQNAFDASRTTHQWNYLLVDQTPPVIASVNPPAGSLVTNLTGVEVTFSEPVAGVNAGDLLINGAPAVALSVSGTVYTFSFPQPNASLLMVTWANTHGIRDLAATPNAFDHTMPGASWSYATADSVAPTVATVSPAPFITLRLLNQIRVTFSEPVTGVDTNDLLINGRRTRSVTGSGAGPYTFSFLPPSNGPVNVAWATTTGIRDLATPTSNAFTGGNWSYVLDPAAGYSGQVIISEIMFNPAGGRAADEWIELRNLTATTVNLAGWRFSRGLNYTFPNVSLDPNGYLVVAANVAAFQSNHPDVTNVVGGWTGSLADSEETIALESALGESVNSVHYATEGDWAQRERGRGAKLATRITRNGGTASVISFDHGMANNDVVVVTGADQPEYNGRFTVSGVSADGFNIAISGAPATPATGVIVLHHALHNGASGFGWSTPADGLGPSLELISTTLGNDAGQNWLASTNAGGTPGRANSVAAANLAPLILDVTHFPPVPKSTEPVTITARVRDEFSNGVASVDLFWRHHTGPGPVGFSRIKLLDDGAHGDGLNRDGLFGAVLPVAPNGTVIEFYLEATDTNGLLRTWPAPTWETNNTFAQLANALYQVDDEVITNLMQSVRVIMTGTERAAFPPANRNSDAEVNCTFISTDGEGTKTRYFCGARVRGAGSRSRTPPNNRLNIPNDNPWNGLSAVNLNGQFVHAQLVGAAVARKAGVPASDAQLIQYRINGVNPAPLTAPANGSGNGAGYGTFIMVEPVNGDLAANLFPADPGGNVYRASSGNHAAVLNYLGANPASYLQSGYSKTSNGTENDWSDLMALTFAFSQLPADADYFASMATNVNVEVWMRYFALGTLINFGETSMFNGRGDDYALYRGVLDRRFVPIGHDFDTVFGQGDTVGTFTTSTGSSIYVMLNPPNSAGFSAPNIPLLRRFITNARFAPIWFAELKRLADTVFSPSELNPLFDQLLTGWGNGPTSVTIDAMKAHAAARRAAVLSQIPLALTVSSSLGTSNGLPYTASENVLFTGASHAIQTRRVVVNGADAVWSPWDARWTNSLVLRPGVNRVLVQSLDADNIEFARVTLDVWYDSGFLRSVSGVIGDTVWSPANGPYHVTANLTVVGGATLTIQPGATVFFSPGASLIIAAGGRLLAEGTDAARIHFRSVPGGANWGGLVVNGTPSLTPETRIAYAHFQNNGSTAINVTDGTVFLDQLMFGNPGRPYLSLDRASFVVQNCHFPATTAAFEPLHGSGGIKAGGRGVFRRNFVGRVQGYNDAIDFTGGNRPGPILQVLNNVFMGSDDDLLDFDSTDAWIEGNIFLHTHRNGSPDSASAVSGGSDNADNSQITIRGNLFYDVDHAANAKQTNFYTLINNTIVHQTRVGSQDTNTAVVILADDGTPQGHGMFLEGNIILDAENLTRNLTTALVTFTNNLIHQLAGTVWSGPGGGNFSGDPLLKRIPSFGETTGFNSWAEAQVMWDYFRPQAGSPAIGAGPNGRDLGAVASQSQGDGGKSGAWGISVSGEPIGSTPLTTATLRVDPIRRGNGIPANGFPLGSGFTHYRWRLDGGSWSTNTPTTTPITVAGLGPGPHVVEVSGRNDAGYYQDDPVFGPDAVVTRSRVWTVNPSTSRVSLHEVLASNGGALIHFGTTPDAIELHNASDSPVSLTGYRLTDDVNNPNAFIFPAGASIPARGYLVVLANTPDGTPGYHTGFNLSQTGEGVFLFAPAASGGALLDSVVFGLQLTDRSIGRLSDGSWALTQPTLGAANHAARTGDPRNLRLNEWLAFSAPPFASDFVELLNLDTQPVALGGLFISDEPLGWPARHGFTPLSFIAGNAYLNLVADGGTAAGSDHLNFRLTSAAGAIGVFLGDLTPIDCHWYQTQQPGVSQGRSPNGVGAISFFPTPTPGSANPSVTGPPPFGGALVINEVLAANAGLVEAGRTPDWIELYNGTTNVVNLGDLSLTDNPSSPRKFVFGYGTTVEPGGFVRVVCDPGGLPGTLATTNFALRGAGGGVYLYNSPTNGGTQLSAIAYGIQVPDLSLGRVPDGSANWTLNAPSPGAANFAVMFGATSQLKINEWMADPDDGDDWFELFNPNNLPVALGPLALSDDLNNRLKHRFAPNSFIGTGTNAVLRIHADGNIGAGADHVLFSLRAAGEAVGLSFTNDGALIDGVTFGQQTSGVSEGRFPDGATDIVAFPGTASPGAANWRLLENIVINEVLTHTDLPLEDAIELRNLSALPVDVGGWWLSDDAGTRQKYQIPPPRVIPPFSFTVIYESQFTNRDLAAVPFALSSGGDEVVLSVFTNNALTGFRAKVDFGAAANGVSFGRHVTSDGRSEFVPASARTFGRDNPGTAEEFRAGTGATNAYPLVGPVVITEIMYHPPDLGTNDNARDEFIELRNVGDVPIALFEGTNGWRLRDAVEFDFPPDTVLLPGGRLLVVGFDPVNNPVELATFQETYNLVPGGVLILGPWRGRLANDTDDLELRRPDVPDTNGTSYLLVERVHYADRAPWPPEADRTGLSLQRRVDREFANDPANWLADAPTPGPTVPTIDNDRDGLPDAWEIAHGLDPADPLDAALDADGDGLTNLDEFLRDTDPRDPVSGLRLSIVVAADGSVILSFTAASNFAHAIEHTDALGGTWQSLQDFSAAPTKRVLQLTVPSNGAGGFFRLRSP